jgi:hypothetical protein
MNRIQINSKLAKLWPRRLGAIFLPVFALAAVIAILMLLPTSLAGEPTRPPKPVGSAYEITYEKAKKDLPEEWIWKVKPVNLDNMYRSRH